MTVIGSTTSASDFIAVMVFATFLFLLGMGLKWVLKSLFRLISRKSRPAEPQSMCIDFAAAEDWEEEGNMLYMERFAEYLASKLQSKGLAEFDGGEAEGERVSLYFFGPDAKRMWEEIEDDVRTYAPLKPLEVAFASGGKKGERVVEAIAEVGPRKPLPFPKFKVAAHRAGISPTWGLIGRIGTFLWLTGLAGLFLSWVFRIFHGVTEEEVMRSGFGAFVIFSFSGMLMGGLVIALVCANHTQATAKRPNPGPVTRSQQGILLSAWISNRFILAIVAAVITGIAIALRMKWN